MKNLQNSKHTLGTKKDKFYSTNKRKCEKPLKWAFQKGKKEFLKLEGMNMMSNSRTIALAYKKKSKHECISNETESKSKQFSVNEFF